MIARSKSEVPEHADSATASPRNTPHSRFRTLQRAAGNHAIATLARGNDPAEAQAQEVARGGALRDLHAPAAGNVPHDLTAALGDGMPLDASTRVDAEAQLGAELGDVRLHRGNAAERAANRAGARAFTVGTDVVLGRENGDARSLLMHELTHVLQQRGRPPALQRAEPESGGMCIAEPAVEPICRDEEADAAWYRRASAFLSAMEVLVNVLAEVRKQIAEEQADTFLFSDRRFSRPIVLEITGEASRFSNAVQTFIRTSEADPLLDRVQTAHTALLDAITKTYAAAPESLGTAEQMGRGFVGGVKGAGGSFLGFLRLGLYDSWAQTFSDSSAARINEMTEGVTNLIGSIGEHGFGATASNIGSSFAQSYVTAIENEQFTTAGEISGGAAFDLYFAGRGLVSAGKGLTQIRNAAQAMKALGSPAPYRAALRVAWREATTFRGLGVHGGKGLWGSQYGLGHTGSTVRITRFVKSDADLVSKMARGEGAPLVAGPNGELRPLPDVVSAHKATSSGSPLQSAYPWGDAETAVSVHPPTARAARGSPYYVVLEVPNDPTLIDVNRLLVEAKGVNPATVPEMSVNRYGASLPKHLRPTAGELPELEASWTEPVHARLTPEQRAWVTQHAEVAAAEELKGLPPQYLEWEHLTVGPDLRPYVVEVRPNPLYTGDPVAPLSVKPGTPSGYHPAMNPASASSIARSTDGGWQRFQTYTNWLAQESAAGRLPFHGSQLEGFQNITFLGGTVPELMLPFPTSHSTVASSTSIGGPPSAETVREFAGWMNETAALPPGVAQLLDAATATDDAARGLPKTSAIGTVVDDLSHFAARIRRDSHARVTDLSIAPDMAYVSVSIPSELSLPDALDQARALRSPGRSVRIGMLIVIDNVEDPAAVASTAASAVIPSGVTLSIRTKSGDTLFSNAGQ